MKTKFQQLGMAVLVIAIGSAACKKSTIDDIKSGGKVFSPSLFKENIIKELGSRNIGYTFIINHNGKWADSAARGFARMKQDGAVLHSVKKEMNIASVSKWLTAVGAMKLLSLKNIKPEDPIYPWLPQSWTLGNKVKSITFKELLTHSAGLTTKDIRYGTDYNSLKACIAAGVVNEAKTPNYSNANFALFRIMFSFIDNQKETAEIESLNLWFFKDTATFSNYLADRYISLMQQHVFTPAGVADATCSPESRSVQTLMYNETAPGTAGIATGDWKLVCGGGGYYLSVHEVAKVMAYVYHTEDILSKAQRKEMLDNLYGMDGSHSVATNRGQSYGKDGALYNDSNGSESVDVPDPGLQTLTVKYPGDVELVFFTNALNDGFTYYTSIMKKAYEEAWIQE